MADKKPTPPLYMQDENGVLRPVDPAILKQLQQDKTVSDTSPHQVVHIARPLEPQAPHISEETRRRHEESQQKYPELNLSEGEFVILAIKRHPIGLFPIWGFVTLLSAVTFLVVPWYAVNIEFVSRLFMSTPERMPSAASLAIFLLGLLILFILGGIAATWVYIGNKFFLTNESVVQIIKPSIFSTHEQTVSLANIEDASYQQKGIVQSLFDYGSMRLSTEGDETTYRFNYVTKPKEQIKTLNNAVEAFKNGRPVVD